MSSTARPVSSVIPKRRVTRSVNFSASEDEVLVNEVEKRKNNLFGKFSAVLTKQSKDEEWARVAGAVNRVSTVVRTGDEVKVHWKNLKSKTKKSLSSKMNRKFMNTTGGGEAAEALNSSEIRMLGIIGEVAVTGVAGGFDTSTLTGEFKPKHTCTYIMPNPY